MRWIRLQFKIGTNKTKQFRERERKKNYAHAVEYYVFVNSSEPNDNNNQMLFCYYSSVWVFDVNVFEWFVYYCWFDVWKREKNNTKVEAHKHTSNRFDLFTLGIRTRALTVTKTKTMINIDVWLSTLFFSVLRKCVKNYSHPKHLNYYIIEKNVTITQFDNKYTMYSSCYLTMFLWDIFSMN